MARGGKNNKRNRTTSRAKKKARPLRGRFTQFRDRSIGAAWNNKRTVNQNFEALGIASAKELNSHEHLRERYSRPGHAVQEEFMRVEDAESHERNIANVPGTRGNKAQQKHYHVSASEQEYLRALIAKHGDGYKRMERDIKLNTQQQSAAKLRRRIARLAVYDKQQQEKAQQAAAAAAGGDDE